MKCEKWKKVLLGTLMAAFVLCVSKAPAWALPGDMTVDLDKYQGPAAAEVQDLKRFMVPIVNELLIEVLDATSVMLEGNPDMVLQQFAKVQAAVDADPSCTPELRNKVRMIINNAKIQKQQGTKVDPEVQRQRMQSSLPGMVARIRAINEKMYTGMRPRLMKIADKDPDYAMLLCDTMLQRLNAQNMQARADAAGISESDRKMINLPTEIKKYAMQVKGKQ